MPIYLRNPVRKCTFKIIIISLLFIANFLFYQRLLLFCSQIFSTSQIRPLGHNLQLEIEEGFQKNKIKIKSLKRKKNFFEIQLINGIKVIYDEKNILNKLASLQYLINRFKIEGREISLIDLRYNNPILK